MAITQIKQGDSIEKINQWWDDVHRLYQNDRAAFDEYVTANPEMGIRWHARAANKNVNTGTDNRVHQQQASLLAGQIGYGGADGKEDGKAIATNYDTFPDVNNEWGAGDFWKIGTPQTFGGGFNDFIEDNPLAIVGAVASLAIPALAPALATALGVSPAVATGIINAGFTAATGGDLGDVVKAGLLSYGIADAGNLANKALSLVPDDVLANIHDTILPTIQGSGGFSGTGVLPEGALSLVGNVAQDAATVSGYVPPGGASATYGLLNDYFDTQNDYGDRPPIPPIQDQPAGLPTNPDAGGSSGSPAPKPAPAPKPPQEVEEEEVDWAALAALTPAEREALKELKDAGYDEQGVRDLHASTFPTLPSGGYGGGTKGDDEVAKAERKRKVSTRDWTDPYYSQGLQVSYALPSYSQDNYVNFDYLQRALAGSPAAGQTYSGPATSSSYRPSGGSTPAGAGELSLGGSGYLPGGGTSTGTGGTGGTGSGGGGAGGAQPDVEKPRFDWEGLTALIGSLTPDEESYDFGEIGGQDLNQGIDRPNYGDPTTAYELDIRQRGIQPPMVLPADNSGQASFAEWKDQYDQDVLSAIQEKRTDRGLI